MQFNFKQWCQINISSNIQKISLGKRACLYLFFMGLLGGVAGSIDSKVTLNKCLEVNNCEAENLAHPDIRIGIGACAGMIAAGIISLPALLNDEET